jgi:hypothetical protein
VVKSILVDGLRTQQSGSSVELAATIRVADEEWELWLRTDRPPVSESADAFLATALIPAMRRGLPLRIEGAVSPRVLRGAERVQQTMSVWNEALRIVEVEATQLLPQTREASGAVGAFFSGGVDSFYTLQRHRDEITHLVFVHGFDIRLGQNLLREQVADALRRSAGELELPLIEVETNLRAFGDAYAHWAEEYHGAALAAVALFLAPRFEKILIPATFAYAFLFPYGSHPGLDPLWSSESLEIVHDGCEATRFEKVEALASWDTALRTLRVCWQTKGGRYNCCKCWKCLWTMAFLRACDALGRAATFDRPLDLKALSESLPRARDEQARFVQALDALERRGGDPELAQALHAALELAQRPAAPGPVARMFAGARRRLARRSR